MTALTDNHDRQVIPRWRDLLATAGHGELGRRTNPNAVVGSSEREASGLEDRANEFREHRSLSFAADLVNASIVLGPTADTVQAAEVILHDRRSPTMVVQSAKWILGAADAQDEGDLVSVDPDAVHRRGVAQLRRGLRANPRNALRWVELSRHYINSGHERKAVTAMRIAVNMAPTDRYVLRCAVRLWTHLSDPEQAIRTLGNVKHVMLRDPWLLASEIAASATADRPSRNIRRGREMVEAARHSPFALSELTSALATIEMQAGAARRARKLFRSALTEPNENSVAQAGWASTRITGLDLDEERLAQSAEARARRTAEGDAVEATLSATWEWLIDQPFSTQPAVFGSYHASMHRRFDDGVRFAKKGLRANPRDAVLLNNLAFCEAARGDVADAKRHLAEVLESSDRADSPTLTATRGLVSFRDGDPATGRRLYLEAISAMRNPVDVLRAELMLLSEEIGSGLAPNDPRVAQVIDAVERASDRQLLVWMGYVDQHRRRRDS